MTKAKRLTAVLFASGVLIASFAPTALGGPPGPGSKPQCAGGQFPGSNGNPHCPQNK